MEKKCTMCKEEKLIGEFNKNKTNKDGYNNICRVCSKARSKQYYEENRGHHIKVVGERSKKSIKENQQKIFDYYYYNPCVDCGETNPIVLEFDHRDNVDKYKEVSKMIQNGNSWIKIKREIDKCDVRCANCHRIRTAKQFGWYKDLIINT